MFSGIYIDVNLEKSFIFFQDHDASVPGIEMIKKITKTNFFVIQTK